MKTLRAGLLVVVLIATISIVTNIAVADGTHWVYTKLSIFEIESCFEDVDYWITTTRGTAVDGTPNWTIADRTTSIKLILFTYDEDSNVVNGYESLMVVVRFNMYGSTPSLSRLNNWNRQYRYSTAYITQDHRTAISFDLDLKGGVTKETIVRWLNRTIRQTREFADWIGYS